MFKLDINENLELDTKPNKPDYYPFEVKCSFDGHRYTRDYGGVLNFELEYPQSFDSIAFGIFNGGYDLQRIIFSENIYSLKEGILDIYDCRGLRSIQGFDNMTFTGNEFGFYNSVNCIAIRHVNEDYMISSFPKLNSHLNSKFTFYTQVNPYQSEYHMDIYGKDIISDFNILERSLNVFNPVYHDSIDIKQILENYLDSPFFEYIVTYFTSRNPEMLPWDYIDTLDDKYTDLIPIWAQNKYRPYVIRQNLEVFKEVVDGD